MEQEQAIGAKRVWESVKLYTVKCAKCSKWRLIPTKEKYEEIRERIVERSFLCDTARAWRPNVSCNDESDVKQDDSFLWAMDKPRIPQTPPGWQRILRIRAEGIMSPHLTKDYVLWSNLAGTLMSIRIYAKASTSRNSRFSPQYHWMRNTLQNEPVLPPMTQAVLLQQGLIMHYRLKMIALGCWRVQLLRLKLLLKVEDIASPKMLPPTRRWTAYTNHKLGLESI
ncbi:uncharacterized protein LOC105162342 isoform X1 [Sesamum indicum]|uniref:Uncharacterized protein LOC105162342 isoform X1 n=1 Tax=Sesamum indicum TaxID=4182 RepID=A0A8M8UZD3_SESIN|nr:uncharacterized protein LOC105162342 isoform X1 [Sesamum indicum]XP_020549409.1 uncharacterized protein LOC105162342 isoform X1 [Sesamum indicum]XP_020549410.1 uncharacterized protein LOC105162342 isoform X1 [Sesamum indicum]